MRLLVDLSNLAYRAAHSVDLSHKGRKTGAIYGVLKSLENLLLSLEPSEVVICWDGGSQRRKRIYPEYKGDRRKNPGFMQDLNDQLVALGRFFDTLPVVQCHAPGVEADDVIAVLCAFLHLEEVGIVSNDSDLFRLCKAGHYIIHPKTHVYFQPEMTSGQYLVHRVLVGGKDNVPGVEQVGPVTAKKLIAKFKTLKGILKHSKASGGLGKMNHKEVVSTVKRNLKLWDLKKPQVTEVERKSILTQYKSGRLRRIPPVDVGSLCDLCAQYGLSSFLRRFSVFTGVFKRLKGATSAKDNQESAMDQKDQNSGKRRVKRIRVVERSDSSGKAEKAGPDSQNQAGRHIAPTLSGSKQRRQHQVKRAEDGYVSRIRKVAVDGSTVRSGRSSSQGAIRSAEPGAKNRAVAGRCRGIDFSDPRLSPSKRAQGARTGRRSSAMSILSVLARGDGGSWIRKQDSERLMFVSDLIDRLAMEETPLIKKSEMQTLHQIYHDYLNEAPDWM